MLIGFLFRENKMSEKFRKNLGAALAVTIALAAGGAAAQSGDGKDGVHGFLGIGLTNGGDRLFTANYVDGESEDINAGELFQFGAGVQWNASNSPLALAVSINYHGDTANASNGKANFKRYPLEAIAYYRTANSWRFGLGVRYVMSPTATYQVDNVTDEELSFDDAVGAVAEIGYGFTPSVWLNLRGVNEKYQPETFRVNGTTVNVSNAEKVDGSHVGINLVYLF